MRSNEIEDRKSILKQRLRLVCPQHHNLLNPSSSMISAQIQLIFVSGRNWCVMDTRFLSPLPFELIIPVLIPARCSSKLPFNQPATKANDLLRFGRKHFSIFPKKLNYKSIFISSSSEGWNSVTTKIHTLHVWLWRRKFMTSEREKISSIAFNHFVNQNLWISVEIFCWDRECFLKSLCVQIEIDPK